MDGRACFGTVGWGTRGRWGGALGEGLAQSPRPGASLREGLAHKGPHKSEFGVRVEIEFSRFSEKSFLEFWLESKRSFL